MRITSFLAQLWMFVGLAMIAAVTPAQEKNAGSSQTDTPAAEEAARSRKALTEQAATLRRDGRLREAVDVLARKLDGEKRQFGELSEQVGDTLGELAEVLESLDDLEQAKATRQQVLRLVVALFGENHWRATDARLAQDFLKRLSDRAMPEQNRKLTVKYRDALHQQQAFFFERDFKAASAMRASVKLLHDQVRALPFEDDLLNAQFAVNEGYFFFEAGEYAEVPALWEQALKLRVDKLSMQHPQAVSIVNDLGALAYYLGDYNAAGRQFQAAYIANKSLYGSEHLQTATALNNLATVADELGDYSRAVRAYREAAEILRRVRGEDHQDYAAVLNNLGILYRQTGDLDQAELHHLKALEIRRQALGVKHRYYAQSLYHIATVLADRGQLRAAEQKMIEAVEAWKEAVGDRHDDYARSIGALGVLHENMGEFAKAEPLLIRSRDIALAARGREEKSYAESCVRLARLYRRTGDLAASQEAGMKAKAVLEAEGLEDHPIYATALHGLANVALLEKDYAGCNRYMQQALTVCRNNVELSSAVQSERQQMSMLASMRELLDSYLDMSSHIGAPPAEAYSHWLAWKGAVALRQRHYRLSRGDEATAKLLNELELTTSRLASKLLAGPSRDADGWRRAVEQLGERKESLESQLADSPEFRLRKQRPASDAAEIAAALPAGGALVDFAWYRQAELPNAVGVAPEEGEKPALREPTEGLMATAFVLRPQRELVRIDLGPVTPIQRAIDAWLQHNVASAANESDGPDPGPLLHQLIWKPLQPYLEEVSIVLISPDGALARFPFAALPGNEPGSYLIEDLVLGCIPIPALLPELSKARDSEPPSNSLLAVGDVDFGATDPTAPPSDALALSESGARRSAPRGSALRNWERLEGTRGEVLTLLDTWEDCHPGAPSKVLRRRQATEEAVRREAPQHRFIHFATHGFFAPPQLRSALQHVNVELGRNVSGWNPGLLSGIVLAGANQPAEIGEDDGILTATELAAVDLRNTELIVLSACETGLGEAAGGEGLLGLQRASQVAGADSVLASLWQVSDFESGQLMQRFYSNLWGKRMPKLQALREAQLAMLRGAIGRGPTGTRQTRPATQELFRAPPRNWAGWTLSGLWN